MLAAELFGFYVEVFSIAAVIVHWLVNFRRETRYDQSNSLRFLMSNFVPSFSMMTLRGNFGNFRPPSQNRIIGYRNCNVKVQY